MRLRVSVETLVDRRRYLTPVDRPRCQGLQSGTVTLFGTVQARGIRDGQRYYNLVDGKGNRLTLPADRVESKS